jgi:predicted transcriptional regulator
MSTLTALTPKQQARALIDALPDNVTWSELAYRLEVRADIEEGLADVKAGRVVSTTELRRDFGCWSVPIV